MALMAWAPKGYIAPMELLAVELLPGKVTEWGWWEALSDRVGELAIKAGREETMRACNALNVPMTEELYQAGQSLVLHNLTLRQAIDLSLTEGTPFPAVVENEDPEARDALELTLMEWVDLAFWQTSESSLD